MPGKVEKRERKRLAPQDPGIAIAIDIRAGLISVEFHEHVADPNRRALLVGHDDLTFSTTAVIPG